MNKDRVKGQGKQLQRKVKARWGKLTNDDLQLEDGNSGYLVGKLRERRGMARDAARKQIQEFERGI